MTVVTKFRAAMAVVTLGLVFKTIELMNECIISFVDGHGFQALMAAITVILCMTFKTGVGVFYIVIPMHLIPIQVVTLSQIRIRMAIITCVAHFFFLMAGKTSHHFRYCLSGKMRSIIDMCVTLDTFNIFFVMRFVTDDDFSFWFKGRSACRVCMANITGFFIFDVVATRNMAGFVLGKIIIFCPSAAQNILMAGFTVSHLIVFFVGQMSVY